jgi:hypothetical protein
MDTLNNDHLNILILPNEMLLTIFNKLSMIDVFYSVVDVNERLNHLILDSVYTRNLNMVNITMKSFYDRTFSIDTHVLDRICKKVLPRIHHQVNELTVEQYSMKRILHTVNYPQLYSLSLINFQAKRLLKCLTGIVFNY